MRKLEKRKKVLYLGRVQLRGWGRPQDVWSCRHVKRDWVYHEVLITEYYFDKIVSRHPIRIIRGEDVNQTILPDAEIWLPTRNGTEHLFLEMDTGSCGYADVKKRMKKYEAVDDLVLWVTLTDARMRGLMNRAERISATALFATFDADTWIDLNGKEV